MHGYDGHVMVNLYPQRATKPSCMDDLAHLNKSMAHKNLECISWLFEMADFDVWAAWGANVGKRRNSHLLDSLSQIWRAFEKRGGDFDAKWFRLGDLTSAGHPGNHLALVHLIEVDRPVDDRRISGLHAQPLVLALVLGGGSWPRPRW